MEQLTQKLKNGAMRILEVPIPALKPGAILVRNHFSLISAGTDASTVKAARKGYLGKAMERPQQFKQVLETVRSQGLTQAYRAVMKKLDAYSSLGYSCAGEVIECAEDAVGFREGDLVACGGLSACHAEVICAPVNLCVKLSRDADLKQAAYNSLGAIALQGVRQAGVQLGETCAVIGLGLLGQLTAFLLKASGSRVIGVDIDPAMVEAADKVFDFAALRDNPGLEEKIFQFTGGLGCDAVIIAAASQSLDPINFAGAIARKRGVIVIVGAVPTGFDREPHFYKKELQVRMSCSYGPGRYDHIYEEKGVDYPASYVRWTENRNMMAFQNLLQEGRMDISSLTTHTFPLPEAPSAYEMLLEKKEPYLGILIRYDAAKPAEHKSRRVRVAGEISTIDASRVGIGFLGAGSYAQSHLLPNLQKDERVALRGVMTTNGANARSVAERFGFAYCATDPADILGDSDIGAVFIASRHDSHAEYVKACLDAGKHVFVEKPLCLTEEELDGIRELYMNRLSEEGPSPALMVGYNRRFSPFAEMMRKKIGPGPMSMLYRINAGRIGADSWIQDPQWGGGRIVGEVCHFVDLLTFISGSLPETVYAAAMSSPEGLNDTLNISLSYQDGSIGSICYYANGDKALPKERLEVFAAGCAAVVEDFKKLSFYAGGKKKTVDLMNQDKGQKSEVKLFIDMIAGDRSDIISFDEIYSATLTTLRVLNSLRLRAAVNL